jgi:hypothetical protein
MALTSFIPTLWAASVLENLRPMEVVAQLTNRQYEGTAQSGNKVTVNSLAVDAGSNSIVQDYATGTGGGPRTHRVDGVASTAQDIQINQEKALAFQVGDIDRVQAAGSFDYVTRDAAKLLSMDAESYIIGTMTAGGTAVDTTALVTPDDAVNKVLALRTALAHANVPAGDRYLVVNPDFSQKLLDAGSKLSTVNESGMTQGLYEATIGRLYGFNIVESNMLGTIGQPAAIALHTSAVAYVNQIQEVEGFRSQTSFADVIRMLHVYGAKVLRPTAVQVYLSAA